MAENAGGDSAANDVEKNQKKGMSDSVFKGRKELNLTWKQRCNVFYLCFHPEVCGGSQQMDREMKTAQAGGAIHRTMQRSTSMDDAASKKCMHVWHPMLNKMTWKDVRNEFRK